MHKICANADYNRQVIGIVEFIEQRKQYSRTVRVHW